MLQNIILLVVVLIVFHKLRNLLGTRPSGIVHKIDEEKAAKIIELIKKETEKATGKTIDIDATATTIDDADGSEAVLASIPDFNRDKFLNGAKKAFEIIITSFSNGDIASLKSLVHKNILKKFQDVIESREKDGIKSETDLIGFENVEITDAKVAKNNIIKITVKFISEQINILRNAKEEIIEGDENFIQSITDIWTFERPIDSSDPNWMLVSTKK